LKVTVIGAGYVGLVSGACLADVGNRVVCLDVDPEKIRVLQSGGVPIHEPGLEELVRRNIAAGRLRFTTDSGLAVHHGTIQFIAVGTPPEEDGSADLQYVLAAARDIGRLMTDYKLVANKSTVPLGTGEAVRTAIAEELGRRGVDIRYSVVSNPEFLKEGAAVEDFTRPDRIVVGADVDSDHAIDLMRALYAPFNRNHDRIVVMDVRSAELTKYAANAMLATKISFMNEMANIAERVGADIEQVRLGIGSDPRIGYHFIYPGAGYGGSCFPKDVKALERMGARSCLRTACPGRGRGNQRGAEGTLVRVARQAFCRRSCVVAPLRFGGSPSSRIPTTCAKHRAGRCLLICLPVVRRWSPMTRWP
jgi:UDPglucose 6-dehydrogenase